MTVKKIATPQGSQNKTEVAQVTIPAARLPVPGVIRETAANKKGRSSGKSAAPTTQGDDTPIVLVQSHGEPRVDSRDFADHLGVQHESAYKALRSYQSDFESLGIFRFEIGEIVGPGRPEQFAYLSEDQCYLLLSYSKNTAKVRSLKLKLVKAFREARDRQTIADTQYLPGYRALHDEVMALAQIAHDHGSLAGDDVFHCNANRLVNKAAGISPGMRSSLSHGQCLMVTNIQVVLRNALATALAAGADHKEAYRQAKEAALSFANTAGRLLGGAA